ncbi:transposase [Humibacillus sp. DSM 29435]|uniref:IS1380 family transposase n=1 Tax=Humibacillus sp. DSM 29435 TaxID=1869167 RepID=UPI00087306D4|nr:IS1380 family transposase [Humibacillus sp. DSM 29435]OFE15191.1 transposase [Humibacillus sp. DSM 29435]
MKLSHTLTRTSAVFDDPNLVSSAGLVPVMALADAAGLRKLTDERLTVATDKGANAGLKIASLIGGMLAGADSIDDMAVLRHGGTSKVFNAAYAPSTLGSFLRAFTFGHARQLDAVAARFLLALARLSPLVSGPVASTTSGASALDTGGYALVDVDDTIIEVHGHQKQGAGFGYSKVRGLNAILATLTTAGHALVIVAQRLRKGSCGSPRGAARLIGDAVKQARRLLGPDQPVLFRMDSAFFGGPAVRAARASGADVSVTVRLTATTKAAIATIDEGAWTTIEYTDAIRDEATGAWISRAEVAEIPFTAFAAQKTAYQVPGRLVVRRIPDANAERNHAAGQDILFNVWRFHAFLTTAPADTLDTVAADQLHRHHAIIEQVHADLKSSALAHLPSGKFTANAAWLVLAVIAFNLTRAAATTTGQPALAKSTTATTRRTLITVPTRIASSARRITLHLPKDWPWENAWTELFTLGCGPPPAAART